MYWEKKQELIVVGDEKKNGYLFINFESDYEPLLKYFIWP